MKLGAGTTPGPWELQIMDIHAKMRQDVGYYADGGQWCPVASVTGIGPYERNANARLIAKAPLLIECRDVLNQLIEFWDNGTAVHNGSDVSNEVRALLAKLESKIINSMEIK